MAAPRKPGPLLLPGPVLDRIFQEVGAGDKPFLRYGREEDEYSVRAIPHEGLGYELELVTDVTDTLGFWTWEDFEDYYQRPRKELLNLLWERYGGPLPDREAPPEEWFVPDNWDVIAALSDFDPNPGLDGLIWFGTVGPDPDTPAPRRPEPRPPSS